MTHHDDIEAILEIRDRIRIDYAAATEAVRTSGRPQHAPGAAHYLDQATGGDTDQTRALLLAYIQQDITEAQNILTIPGYGPVWVAAQKELHDILRLSLEAGRRYADHLTLIEVEAATGLDDIEAHANGDHDS